MHVSAVSVSSTFTKYIEKGVYIPYNMALTLASQGQSPQYQAQKNTIIGSPSLVLSTSAGERGLAVVVALRLRHRPSSLCIKPDSATLNPPLTSIFLPPTTSALPHHKNSSNIAKILRKHHINSSLVKVSHHILRQGKRPSRKVVWRYYLRSM